MLTASASAARSPGYRERRMERTWTATRTTNPTSPPSSTATVVPIEEWSSGLV